jgi:hypothetical protein
VKCSIGTGWVPPMVTGRRMNHDHPSRIRTGTGDIFHLDT